MRIEGLIFANQGFMSDLGGDQALEQVANVAHLPGIVGPSIVVPATHCGYGVPIGGVAAFDEDAGVVSPSGVGYDINCGVRQLATPLIVGDVQPRLKDLVDVLYATILSGLGASRSDVRLSRRNRDQVLRDGARWTVAQGYGRAAGIDRKEAQLKPIGLVKG